MNEINKSKLYLAILMIAMMLSFAVLEGLKKVGRLPEFSDDHRLYAVTAGVILVALIGVVLATRLRDKVEE